MTEGDRKSFDASAYREFFEATSEALFVHDLAGRIVLVNARTCTMFEYPREKILALSVADLSSNEPPYTQANAAEKLRRAIAEGECSFEWRSRRGGGDLFWTEVALRRFELDGKLHVMASVRDIDARKHIEAALRESEERFGTIFNATSTMLAFTERDQGRIIDVNEAWLRTAGMRREEAIGKTGRELGLWEDFSDRERILNELGRTGRVHEAEVRLVMGGRAFPAQVSVQHLEMRGERYILWEVSDITERKRAEREQEQLRMQLLQAQKMESIGQLAGGIAHDFNNIVSAILGFGELVLQKLPKESTEASFVEEMVRAGDRARELTTQLLAFSRKQVMRPRVVDPVAAVRGVEPMLRRLIGEDVLLTLALSSDTHAIRVDVSQLEQVIVNLAVNARDAMPEGGTLTIETENVDFDAAYASTHADAVEGPHVMIAVSDTGAGMDPETRARAFEPFFTTKALGTGLGLSTVYGIVKQSGGFIWLYSEQGRGSTFKLYFPRSADVIDVTHAPVTSPALPRPETVVLLVEDDTQVRSLVATILREAGYTVLVAADPRDALALAEGFADPIDLLVTDVVMPHLSGRQLADKITERRPKMRVMYVSGYTENTIVHRGELDAGVNFLPKPITASALLAMVARVLGDPQATP